MMVSSEQLTLQLKQMRKMSAIEAIIDTFRIQKKRRQSSMEILLCLLGDLILIGDEITEDWIIDIVRLQNQIGNYSVFVENINEPSFFTYHV